MNQTQNLTNGNINKSLLNMACSIALGFVSLFSFNLIDTFFIAQLGSEHLAAIGFIFPVIFLWMNIFFGLNTGITAQVGKLIGKNDLKKTSCLIKDGLLLVIIISILISIVGYLSTDITFKFLGSDNNLLIYIKQYIYLWYTFFVFMALSMAIGAAIRGSGDTKTPSIALFYSGILNGILDPLLIFGLGPFPRLEIAGAMIATIISWLFATLYLLYQLIYKTKLLEVNFLLNKDSFRLKSIKKNITNILNIGLPSAASNIISPLSSIIIFKIVAIEGFAAVAAFGVGMRLEALSILFSISLSIAMVPFVSQNHGAKNYNRINQGLKYAIKITFYIQMFIYLFFIAFSKYIALSFSSEPEIIKIITLYLRIIPGAYCFVGIIMIILSALNSIENAKYSTLINFIRFFILTIPCAYLGQYLYGVTGILVGIVIAKIYAFIVAITIYRRQSSRLI